jgi:hypothetical protein
MDASELAKIASQCQRDVVELKAVIRQMQARLERQSLVMQTLKDMLLAGTKATEDQFLERLQEKAANKADSNVCQKCDRPMSAKHTKCIYCGEPRPAELF